MFLWLHLLYNLFSNLPSIIESKSKIFTAQYILFFKSYARYTIENEPIPISEINKYLFFTNKFFSLKLYFV